MIISGKEAAWQGGVRNNWYNFNLSRALSALNNGPPLQHKVKKGKSKCKTNQNPPRMNELNIPTLSSSQNPLRTSEEEPELYFRDRNNGSTHQ